MLIMITIMMIIIIPPARRSCRRGCPCPGPRSPGVVFLHIRKFFGTPCMIGCCQFLQFLTRLPMPRPAISWRCFLLLFFCESDKRCFSIGFYMIGQVNGQMKVSEGTRSPGVEIRDREVDAGGWANM